jgi:hypothetical protein
MNIMYPSFEKFVATRLPSIAARGVCMKKHDLAMRFVLEGFFTSAQALEARYGTEYRSILWKTQYDLGYRIASEIKQEYRLGDDLDAAIDLMWMLIVPFGIRMKTTKLNPGCVREEKLQCPIHDLFKSMKVNYCNELCLAMTSGWLAAINPRLTFQMVRLPDSERYCIKDIILPPQPSPSSSVGGTD